MIEWLSEPIAERDKSDRIRAQEKQNQLTKPPGSLGTLESIAINISTLQKTQNPSVEQAEIIIYAADHGIAQEDVSAFPQAVTAEMVKNFSSGGAAISVLSKQHGLPLQIINLGLVTELPEMALVKNHTISKGTNSFLQQSAMSKEQMSQAFDVAKNRVDYVGENACRLLILGEMGIANTSSASALVCALELIEPEELTGSGTGLDSDGLEHKIRSLKALLAII